jgi:hypothetical protein
MRSLREFDQFVGNPGVMSMQSLSYYLFGDEIDSLNPMTLRTMIQQFEALPAPFDFALDVKPPSGSAPLLVNTSYAKFAGVRIQGVPGNSGFRVLKDGQVVRVIPSQTGFAHKFEEGGRYVIEGSEEGVGRDGYARVVKTVTVDVKAAPPPPQTNISVSAKGDGSFAVTGSGFLPNTTVHIRVVDDALATIFLSQSSTSQGTLNYTTGKICQLPGRLYFSANDGRSDRDDLTGTLWSNTATTTCS